MTSDHRLDLVGRLSGAFLAEIGGRDPDEPLAWPTLPTVAAMTGHLGGVHRWAAEVVRTRRDAEDVAPPAEATWEALQAWFAEGRMLLLGVLTATDPDEPCWILGDRRGTAGFWRRRMVFETAKHLIDVRAAGGGAWRAAAELDPVDYADGIDELFAEFLGRSRPGLAPLPGAVVLAASDVDRVLTVGSDWGIHAGAAPEAAARVTATAGDLALLLWERAEPSDAARFAVSGDAAAVAALRAAPIHPWRPSA